MKTLAFILLSVLPMRGLTQPLADSTQTVEVPRWQMWRLIHEVQLGRLCDSLVREQHNGIEIAYYALEQADSTIKAKDGEIDALTKGNAIQVQRIANLSEEKQELKKEIKRQKGLTIAVGVVSLIMIIIIL